MRANGAAAKRGAQVCVCGDYRRQHMDEEGPCVICAKSSAPWDICKEFRRA